MFLRDNDCCSLCSWGLFNRKSVDERRNLERFMNFHKNKNECKKCIFHGH